MKKHWTLYILAAFILQLSLADISASAETVREAADRKQHDANRESEKAARAKTDARVDRVEGHGLMAKIHSHHARHEQARAYKHSQEAKADRAIARHQFR
jgi:hypothetical protein